MQFNEYQQAVQEYKPFKADIDIFFNLFDLTSSVGELTKKVNNVLMNNLEMDKEQSIRLGISVGDILCALTNFAYNIGMTLDEIAKVNLKKIELMKEQEVKKQNSNPIKIDS